jgi:hypothetical protein
MKLSIVALAAIALSVMGMPIQDISKQIEQREVCLLQTFNVELYDYSLLM